MAVPLRTDVHRGRTLELALVAGGVLVLALVLLAESHVLLLRSLAIVALAWWLPGALLVALWRLPDLDLPTGIVLAAGLGLCWLVLVALLIHWLPGPTDFWILIGGYSLGAVGLLAALYWRRLRPLQPTSLTTWAWLAALLLCALLLRLPGLGYHEFHIDEVEVLRRARWAIEGVDQVLLVHTKGPGEIMVALVGYRALGTATETTARLPFALIGVSSVLATAVLGRRLFSAAAGFWAGLLLAANGFALALSRIVQYQPAVLLLSAVSVLSAWEFARRSDVRWLALAAAFSTCGVVMHYEFALLAPALVAVAWAGWRRAPDRGQVLRKATPAALLSAIVIAAVYVPLLLSPHSAKIQRQLIARLGGLGAWGLPSFVEIGTLYNAGFFILGLMLLAGVGLLVGWHRARRQTYLLVLWFLPSLILLILVMRRPGTHFYLLMPSWSLLAALPLAALAEKRHWPWLLRGILWGLAVVWLALSLGYLYLAFFRQAPEYILHYEEERLPIYAAPYGEQVPLEPRFGFPIHEGWKTLGLLARWGCLGGTYATNEGSNFHQLWYIRDLTHTGLAQSPDYLFVAEHVQAPVRARDEASFEGYYQVGSVKVRDEPRIEIWTNQILPVPYVTYQSEDFAPLFDSTVPALDNGSKIPLQTLGYRLGAGLLLESVGLAQTRLRPGDRVHLMLVWHPKMALAKDYKVFVHLVGDNAHPLAQWDGYPCFNLGRTSQWVPGALITDHLLLPIPDELPPGQYRLLAGMYEESSGERLGGWALEIGRITVY